MPTHPPAPAIDPALSVNETLRRWPASVRALAAHGIDTCCGGASSLRAAAADAGVPLAELLAAIARSTAEGA
jgi:regulator of cell morphogenesis and NO signaling